MTSMKRAAALLSAIAIACTPSMASAERLGAVDFNALSGVARSVGTPDQLARNIIQSINASISAQRSRYDADVAKFQNDQAIMSPDVAAQRTQILGATEALLRDRTAAIRKLLTSAYPASQGATAPAPYIQIRVAVAAAAVIGGYDMVVDTPIYRADQLDLTPRVTAILRGQ